MLIPPIAADPPAVTRYRLLLNGLPPALHGFTILQLSDLHSQAFGPNGDALPRMLTDLRFDLTALTGDLINGRRSRYHDTPALQLVDAVAARAPAYYVTGNHEWSAPHAEMLFARLAERGVRLLRNEAELLEHSSAGMRSAVGVIGMDDLMYFNRNRREFAAALERAVQHVAGAELRVLLSHRPELFPIYCRCGIDVALTGHSHGGQIRIPGVGGIFAPGQGLLARYDGGLFREGRTQMVISRGLGRSIFPLRINNPPEVVVVELAAHPAGRTK